MTIRSNFYIPVAIFLGLASSSLGDAIVGGTVDFDLDGSGVNRAIGMLVRSAEGSTFSDAVASSTDTIASPDGQNDITGISFNSTASNTRAYVGLASSGSSDLSSDFAVQINAFGQVFIIESGINLGYQANYVTGSHFQIFVSLLGQIYYYVDGTLIYNSSSTVQFPLRTVVAFGENGAITAPVWVGKSLWCNGVVCQPSECHEAGECSDGICSVVVVEDGTACHDSNASTVTDICLSGVCRGNDPCDDVECPALDTCHGVGRCSFGQCYAGTRFDDNSTCDDGNTQTTNDRCASGICLGTLITQSPSFHPTVSPSTTFPSVSPSLSPSISTPTSSPSASTTIATTSTLSTTQGAACDTVVCPDPDQCHEAMRCVNGLCFIGNRKVDGTACDDGNSDTSNDRCLSGVCTGTDLCVGVNCTAENECQFDGTCVEGQCVESYVPNGVPCNDNNIATTGDRCSDGQCVGINSCLGVTCTPISGCHIAGTCIRGICSNPFAPANTPCNDGNGSTLNDVCSDSGTCTGVDPCDGVTCTASECFEAGNCILGQCLRGTQRPVNTSCNDGNSETFDEVCNENGECVGTDLCDGITCEQEICHTTAICSQGSCNRGNPVDDFTECDDGNAGTDNDICIDGVCVGEVNRCFNVTCDTPPTCQSNGQCDSTTGLCQYGAAPDGASCDDGNSRTDNDICVDEICSGEDLCNGITCPPPVQCQLVDPTHINGCFRGICMYIAEDDETPCNDASPDTDDFCMQGVCVGLDYCANVTCTATNDCHEPGVCVAGVCGPEILLSNGTQCDDNNNRTDFDACIDGTCVGVDACDNVICESTSLCMVSSCFRGVCSEEPLENGLDCDDGDINIVNTTCFEGQCIGVDTCENITCTPLSDCQIATCILGDCSVQQKPDSTPCSLGELGSGDDESNVTEICRSGVCEEVDWCELISCRSGDQCHGDSECSFGRCRSRPVLLNYTCDDTDPNTVLDTCRADGTCSGIDPCDNMSIICEVPDDLQCQIGGGCFRGECASISPRTDGTPCDDLNSETVGDQCLSGTCTGTDLCADTFCGAATACLREGECSFGTCIQQVAEPDGTLCDDDDIFTDLDTCQNGACTGINTCAPSLCQASTNPCTIAVCRNSSCTEISRPDGYFCDDGNRSTDIDQCSNGTCIGIDSCEGITCSAIDQCHIAGTCTSGQCSNPPSLDNTPCNDQDGSTELDLCIAGSCNGFNPCDGVECDPETSCMQAAVCILGQCQPRQHKSNFTLCNDGLNTTYADVCIAGICSGRLPCIEGSGCIAFNESDSIVENVNYGLTRIDGQADWNRGSISLDSIVPGQGLFGGITFTPAQQDKNVFVGLGYPDSDNSFQSIEYAIYMSLTGHLLVYEAGRFRTDILGTYDTSSPISIYIDAHRRVVYENGRRQYISTVIQSTAPLHVEVSIFDSGASVDRFRFATRQDVLCASIVCPTTPQCYQPSECVLGQCTNLTEAPVGSVCDDSNATTDLDRCIGGGICIGVDLCIGVVCEDFDFCQTPVTCSHGQCSECIDACEGVQCSPANQGSCYGAETCFRGQCVQGMPSVNGTICDDGDSETGFDRCDGSGNCDGLVLCDNIQCPEAQVCEESVQCAAGQCITQYTASGTLCDDGLEATLEDACDGNGRCIGIEYCGLNNITCDLPDQCHEPTSCFQGVCLPHPNVNDNTPCDDGDDDTINDTCQQGTCRGVNLCDNVECPRASDCTTSFFCLNGTCIPTYAPTGSNCNDSDNTTAIDECDGQGTCIGWTLQSTPECVAEIRCNGDACITTVDSEGDPCSDGNDATQDDACDGAGACIGHDYCIERNVVCDLPDQCHLPTTCYHGSCLPYQPKLDNTDCDDGNRLTDFDVCTLGVCAGVDFCVLNNVQCDPGPCISGGTCENGECRNRRQYADDTSCDDGDNHTLYDRCESGVCTGIDLCEGIDCPEPRACFEESTCFQGQCLEGPLLPPGTQCDDENPQTENDQCDVNGVCAGIDLCALVQCPPPSLDQCLVATGCNRGICSIQQRPLGFPCDDGDNTTDNDVCTSTGCQGVDLCVQLNVVCDTAGPCEVPSTCQNGVCSSLVPKLDGTACDDGNSNTLNDTCIANECSGINPCDGVVCPQLACHEPSICMIVNGQANCTNLLSGNGVACDDNDIDTIDDVCIAGSCFGTSLTCRPVISGEIQFSNGCGGLNTDNLEWSTDVQGGSDCICYTDFGVAFAESSGIINSSTLCSQAICQGGVYEFATCSFQGARVAQASRISIGQSTLLRLSRAYEDILCNRTTLISTTVVPVTSATSSTVPPGTTTTPETAVCSTAHSIDWRGQSGLQAFVFLGDSVTWTWGDSIALNVVIDGQFRSGQVSLSGAYTYVFNTVGEFQFYSESNQTVRGTIYVSNRVVEIFGVRGNDTIVSLSQSVSLNSEALERTVFVGQIIRFTWDTNNRVLVTNRACGTLIANRMFSSVSALGLGLQSYSIQFLVPGIYDYSVVAIGDTVVIHSTITVLADGSEMTSTTQTPTTTVSSGQQFNMIDTSSHNSGPGDFTEIGGSIHTYYTFGRSLKGIEVLNFPTPNSSLLSFAFAVNIDRFTGGYLFALADATGRRYVSLYARPGSTRRQTVMYYRAVGSTIQRSVTFDIPINLGYDYQILFSVEGTAASLTVVSQAATVTPEFTQSRDLAGAMDVCTYPSPSCKLVVGARPSSTGEFLYGISGTIRVAKFYPSSIGQLPEPTMQFSTVQTTTVNTNVSGNFDLLAGGVSVVGSSTIDGRLGDGSYSFSGTDGLSLSNFPQSIGYNWGVGAWVMQTQGTNGYIFAKTDTSGSRRYLGLYSSGSSNKITLYYRVLESRQRAVFNVGISDGQLHRIRLNVVGVTATLSVDFTNYTANLVAAPIEDCGSPSTGCHFTIGQRMSPTGGAYRFNGIIYSPVGFSSSSTIQNEDIGDPRVLRLVLEPTVFNGIAGNEVRKFRTVDPSSFSIAIRFTAENNSYGYLLAKSNAAGSVRNFGIYGNTRQIQFYYKPAGSTSHSRVNYNMAVFDGTEHNLLLTVSGTQASLRIDNQSPQSQTLVAPVDDCIGHQYMAIDCFLWVGQRANGFPFSGTISSAELYYGAALTQFPN